MSKKETPNDDLFEPSIDTPNIPNNGDFETDLFGSPMRWNPVDEGEFIIGTYRGMEKVDNKESSGFEIGLILTQSQELFSVSGYILTVKILPMLPEGITVKIIYTGEIPVNQPAPMKNYRIETLKTDKEKIAKFRHELATDQ